jgi:hypothetical protein
VFPLRNTHKYTSASRDERLVHILIDRTRYSSIFDARFFRGGDCDTDHYLVLHIRERLSVRKRAKQKLLIGLFHFKKLNDVKGDKQNHIKFSNWSAGADDVDTNRAWENVTEYIKIRSRLFILSKTNSCTIWSKSSTHELLYGLLTDNTANEFVCNDILIYCSIN